MSDIPVVEDFTFIRYRTVIVSEGDVDHVLKRIREIGTFDYEEPSREERYAVVEYYTLEGDDEAEIFWKDPGKTELGSVRVSVVYDEDEEYGFNRINGITKRNVPDEALGDSRSDSLSPYMKHLFDRALGFVSDEQHRGGQKISFRVHVDGLRENRTFVVLEVYVNL